MKKIVSLLLCLLLVATLFVACKGPADDPQDTTDGGTTAGGTTAGGDVGGENPGDDTPQGPAIKVSDLETYVIVYPEFATTDLTGAVSELVNAINAKFGVRLKTVKDYEDPAANEIIVGKTVRPESAEVLDTLLFKDSAVALVGQKLVIAAYDDYTATEAIAAFIAGVVNTARDDAADFVTGDQVSVVNADYTFGSMTIAGANINEYRIVYPAAGTALEAELAVKVQKAIADACGELLEVVSDATAADGAKEIFVGKTNRNADVAALADVEGKGYMALEGANVMLCGNSALGNAIAVDAFIALFANEAAADTIALNVTNGLQEDTDTAISSMSFNLSIRRITDERKLRVLETIVKYLPDTIGLQECSATWRTFIADSALGQYYTIVGVGADADDKKEASYVLYATEKFEAIETGTKWLSDSPDTAGSQLANSDGPAIYTWALLNRKSDNTEIMHVNTSFDTAANNSEVRQFQSALLLDFLYTYSNKAIVLTGCFNANATTTEYRMLMTEFLNDASVIAAVADKGNNTAAADLVDFVFAYDLYVDVASFEAVDDRVNGDFASSHDPLYFEYTVNYEGTDVADKTPSGDGDGLLVVPDRDDSFGTPSIT